MNQRSVRQSRRGKRRPLAGRAIIPWWWDYPTIAARMNPYDLDPRTFARLDASEQRQYAEARDAFLAAFHQPKTQVVIRFANPLVRE